MKETKMGYRGSKSFLLKFNYNSQPVIKSKGVKEQRVDGSCFGYILYPKLRCILTGFERSYPVKILSKHFFNRFYSTNDIPLNPNFVTGFTDVAPT